MNPQETNGIFNKIVQARWQTRRRIQEALQVLDGQGKVRKAFHQMAAIVMRTRNYFYPLWNMILMPWYVSGAKLRTLASIPIPDDRLSLLLQSSCWIELRCNIYTSLKETYQEGLTGTCQESSVLNSDPCVSLVTICDHVVHSDYANTSWPEPWTMCFLLPLYL